jgi:hypothetical protein
VRLPLAALHHQGWLLKAMEQVQRPATYSLIMWDRLDVLEYDLDL